MKTFIFDKKGFVIPSYLYSYELLAEYMCCLLCLRISVGVSVSSLLHMSQ